MEIIYEDENLIALNKPAGVNFDWVLSASGGRPDLLPVHRLDKDTSGVILFAKNEKSQEYLRELFFNHKIKKTYLALVVGELKQNSGTIDLPIGRSKKTPLKRVAIGEQRGKIREAVTEYKVLKRIVPREGSGFQQAYTLVETYPKTGRTHQIRSHFSAIGHPVACDKLYGGKNPKCPAGLARQFLHAYAVEFNLPSGSILRLEADLPEDLKKTLDVLS
ncbi:MAG: RluA family pseudouridine synthase [Candidatus Giovannonibacteria bacterium]|nr:RluA family pseudouridine synthase [Candidatus Giovannonibacteria bacterium]